ncbi:histidine kinase [bacterium SCSIO 12741]|nr:histidine kinase [bacterium SCSIO 12741]
MHLIRLLVCFALALSLMPVSQLFGQGIPYQNLNLDDGLRDQKCYDLHQDELGYLWIGTNTGLQRYDGKNFKNFPTQQNFVNEIYRLIMIYGRTYLLSSTYEILLLTGDSIIHPPEFHSLDSFLLATNQHVHNWGINDSNYLEIGLRSRGKKEINNIIIHPDHSWDLHSYTPKEGEYALVKCYKRGTIVSCHNRLTSHLWAIIQKGNSQSKLFLNSQHIRYQNFLSESDVSPQGNVATAFSHRVIALIDQKEYYFEFDHVVNSGSLWFQNDTTLWLGVNDGDAIRVQFSTIDSSRTRLERFPEFQHVTKFYPTKSGGLFIASFGNGLYYLPRLDLSYEYKKSKVKGIAQFKNKLALLTHDQTVVYQTNQSYDTLCAENVRIDQIVGMPERLLIFGNFDGQRKESNHYYMPWFGHTEIWADSNQLLTFQKKGFFRLMDSLEVNAPHAMHFHQCLGIDKSYYYGLREHHLYVASTENPKSIQKIDWPVPLHSLCSSNGRVFVIDHSGTLFEIVDTTQFIPIYQDSSLLMNPVLKIEAQPESYTLLFKDLLLQISQSDTGFTRTSLPRYSEMFQGQFKSFERIADTLYLLDESFVYRIPFPLRNQPIVHKPIIQFSGKTFAGENSGNVSSDGSPSKIEISTFNFAQNPFILNSLHLYGSESESNFNLTSPTFILPKLPPGDHEMSIKTVNLANETESPKTNLALIVPTPIWQRWWFIPSAMLAFFLPLGFSATLYFRSKIKANELAHRLNVLRSKSVSAQLKPHFTFNAMASIQFLITEGRLEEAEEYLSKFANLLRSVLANMNRSWYSFDLEKGMLENYLAIENLRFQRSTELEFINQTQREYFEFCVPPLFLQVLIENSIHHGIAPSSKTGKIQVIISLQPNQLLQFVVRDNGVGIHPDRLKLLQAEIYESTGLKTLSDRLKLIAQTEKVSCSMEYHLLDQDDYQTEIRILIPIKSC